MNIHNHYFDKKIKWFLKYLETVHYKILTQNVLKKVYV